MSFKNFRLNVIGRIVLIMISVAVLLYFLSKQEFVITSIILILLIILQIGGLVSYVERTNRKLTVFLDAIRHSDFSSSFSDQGLGKSFDELNQAFNEVIREFQKTRATKEEHYNYLQTVVQHISIAILVFTKDGSVNMLNNAFKRMMRISNLRYIHELDKLDTNLSEVLQNIKAGDSELVRVFVDNELMQLSVRATEFRM